MAHRQRQLRVRLLVAATAAAVGDSSSFNLGGLTSWTACRASAVSAAGQSGADVSAPSWTPLPACVNTSVPSTAFMTLLRNGTYGNVSDPYVDDFVGGGRGAGWGGVQDINVTGPGFYTFWWEVKVASASLPGCTAGSPPPPHTSTVRLTLTQASYRTSLFVDGTLVLPYGAAQGPGTVEAIGMNKRHEFVLPISGAAFCGTPVHGFAFLVAPPDNFGIPDGHQGGDHTIAKDLVSQDMAGWDWVAPIPDRNTGIHDDVLLTLDGPGVVVSDPSVAVMRLVRDGAHPTNAANLTASFRVSLRNLDGTSGAAGTVSFSLPSLGVSVSLNVSLPRGDGGWVEVDSPLLTLQDVALWWPHSLGPPTLHAANVTFTRTDAAGAGAGFPSSTLTWRAGLRYLTSDVDASLGGRVFTVNGVRFWVVGGNYIASDQVHRPAFRGWERYSAEVRHHREMGMNLIRLWGGHGGHPEALWDAADEWGVLLFQEFWMSGDCNGRWAGNYSWPLDHAGYLSAVGDTIRRARGHASLFLYNGGNEVYPLDVSPPPDIASGIVGLLSDLEPRTETTYVQSSMGSGKDYTGFDPSSTLAPQDGNYGINDERVYFSRNPGMTRTPGWDQRLPFQPEIGNTAHPEYETLARFLSPPIREAVPSRNAKVVHPVWTFHTYLPFVDGEGVDHVYRLAHAGAVLNASEYSAAAGLAQYDQYQALFEGFKDAMGVWYQALIMWKSAGPWPGFRGALYDFYLSQSGGYWGARAANGAPGQALHVQLNRGNSTLSLVHTGLVDVPGPMTAAARAWDVTTGEEVVLTPPVVVHIPGPVTAGSVLHLAQTITSPPGTPPSSTLLWRVELAQAAASQGTPPLSRSQYVLNTLNTDPSQPQDYIALASARAGVLLALTASAVGSVRAVAHHGPGGSTQTAFVNVTLTHPGVGVSSSGVAVGVYVSLRCPSAAVTADTGFTDDRVLPQWPSDGMFGMLPGETVVVTVEAPLPRLSHAGTAVPALDVVVRGWNVAEVRVPVVVS